MDKSALPTPHSPLEQAVASTIERHGMLREGDRVVVAVSGGPDSVALLHILHRLRARWSVDLVVAHLNHRLRGRDSDEDAAFVERLAAALHLPCVVDAEDVQAVSRERRVSIETAGREVRYAFLDRVAADCNADRIATGHTADDQAETILMRLARGSGTDGAAGIRPVRDGRVIRPLLWVTRREVEAYLTAHRLTARTDASNTDEAYTRNRIRHDIIPLLQRQYNPEIITALCRFGDVLRTETEYLDQETDRVFEQTVIEADTTRIVWRVEMLNASALALRRRVLRRILSVLDGNEDTVAFDQIERTDAFLRRPGSGRLLTLPGGVILERRREIALACAGMPGPFSIPVRVPGATYVPILRRYIETHLAAPVDAPEASAACGLFDADMVAQPLVVRSRRSGDRFAPPGMRGARMIKAILNERDIPRLDRDRVPLLVGGDRILWIIGHRLSRDACVTPSTKRVLVVRVNTEHEVDA